MSEYEDGICTFHLELPSITSSSIVSKMFGKPEDDSDISRIVQDISTKITRLEQAVNETGVNAMDTYASETVETSLLNAVAALRRARNSVRPVNRLPPEILSGIFSLVPQLPRNDRLDSLTRDFGPHALAPLSDLLPLLGVCSLWRSVATTSSFLWSAIDNRNSRAFSIASKYRSSGGPLDVNISDAYHRHPGLTFREFIPTLSALLSNEGHRIREFCAEIQVDFLQNLTAFSGESLKMCQLRLRETMTNDRGEFRPLFLNCTSKLRSLLIKPLLFIPSNDFPSLTHLMLGGFKFGPSVEPTVYTFSNFLLFLSRCPNLEVIHLHTLDVADLHDLPEEGLIAIPLNLHCLRKLSNEELIVDNTQPRNEELYFGPQFRRALLAHLQLSPDCVIRLATMLPFDLARSLHHIPFDTPLTSMYLGADGGGNGVSHECLSIMATDPHRERGIRIDFQMPGTRYVDASTESGRAAICDAVRGAPLLAGVHELWAVPGATVLLEDPCSLFGSFPHLTTLVLGLLVVSPDDLDEFRCQWEPLRALEIVARGDDDDCYQYDDDDDPVIPCPRLRTLCVYVTTKEHVIDLYAMLLSRGEAGYPIRRLVVGFYRPPEHTVLEVAAGLAGLVEDFTLLRPGEQCSEDLLWVHRLPFVCRDSSERNAYWPGWM